MILKMILKILMKHGIFSNFNKHGIDINGLDKNGYNINDLDINGLDKNGCNINGIKGTKKSTQIEKLIG